VDNLDDNEKVENEMDVWDEERHKEGEREVEEEVAIEVAGRGWRDG